MAPTKIIADPHTVAPAPWVLKGQSWLLPYFSGGGLPADAYPSVERGTPYADPSANGTFRGSMGAVLIVRYTETDVGPYDELMFIPGYFDSPVTNKAHPRITTIYVSSEVSVRNGRTNWGIPKYLAKFSFTTANSGNKATHVSVSLPGSESTPFFRCMLTPARYIPSIPLSQKIPLPSLVQPPIPAPTDPSSMFVGRPDWVEVQPGFGGWSRLVWVKGEREGGKFGDGDAFPDIRPSGWGFELADFDGVFPVGKVLTAESQKTK